MITLGEVAADWSGDEDELPICRVIPGQLPGRGGTVACQGEVVVDAPCV